MSQQQGTEFTYENLHARLVEIAAHDEVTLDEMADEILGTVRGALTAQALVVLRMGADHSARHMLAAADQLAKPLPVEPAPTVDVIFADMFGEGS